MASSNSLVHATTQSTDQPEATTSTADTALSISAFQSLTTTTQPTLQSTTTTANSNDNNTIQKTASPPQSQGQGLDTLIEEWRNSFDGLFDGADGEASSSSEVASVHIKSSGIVAQYFGQAHQAHGTEWEVKHADVAAELALYYSRWPKGVL